MSENEIKKLQPKRKKLVGKGIRKFFGAFTMTKSRKKLRREETIVVTNEINAINECYNTLKANILYMTDIEKNKVLQIESSVSGEGKTTLACNLAVSMSFNEKKVLIMDLDFRKPRVNRIFNVSNESGLVDYISENITFEQLIKTTAYKNVDVITRGSAIYNPTLLLTSKKFQELVAKLRNMYDWGIVPYPMFYK